MLKNTRNICIHKQYHKKAKLKSFKSGPPNLFNLTLSKKNDEVLIEKGNRLLTRPKQRLTRLNKLF